MSSNSPGSLETYQHIQSLTHLVRSEPNLKWDNPRNIQGSLCLIYILQLSSGYFVTNTLLVLIPSMLQVDLNFRSILLMKQLWITHLIFLNMSRFYGSNGRGSMMRTSKARSLLRSFTTYYQDAIPMYQELFDHWCQAWVKGLQGCIHLQHPRWCSHNFFVIIKLCDLTHAQNDQTSIISWKYEGVSVQTWYP